MLSRRCAIAMVLAWPVVARAADVDDGRMHFPQGTFDLVTYGTYAGAQDRDAGLAGGNIGFGYFVFDNLSIGAEANGYSEHFAGRQAYGYGVSAVLRQHLFRFDRETIYADVSFGPIESTQQIPVGGTYFNYLTRTGPGLTYRLDDHLNLMLGVRYFHLSNARLEGPEHNPSLNGIEGVFGFLWTP